MKITKLNKIINEKDGKQYFEFYPTETVFTVEGDFEDKNKELKYNEIKEFILKNTDKIKFLSVKAKYFKYEDLVLCLIFDNFEYSSDLLSISKANEKIEIRKETRIIKFPEILKSKYFPFVEEEEIEIFEIIQLIDNKLIIKKEENFIEFSYNDSLVFASNNFVIKATPNKYYNGEFQIYDFNFNKNFKPFEMKNKLGFFGQYFEISNDKFKLAFRPFLKGILELHTKGERDYLLEILFDFSLNKILEFQTNPIERFGVNQFNSFEIIIKMLENFQCFLTENDKKTIQDWIEMIKKQFSKENKIFNELKPNVKLENILNNLKNIF